MSDYQSIYVHKKSHRAFFVKRIGNIRIVKDPCTGIYCEFQRQAFENDFRLKVGTRSMQGRVGNKISSLKKKGIKIKVPNHE